MDRRYQIFISSTYADLKEERDKVMRAVLQLKCFPAGMELFPAVDKKQFDYIKSEIDECDYYLLIIGARYGSMDKDGVSYTEKEYNYAVRKKIPVIAFLHNDIKSIPLGKADTDIKLIEKLEKFREKVQKGRLVNYWTNPDDLKAKVLSSIPKAIEFQPRTGWVRTDEEMSGSSPKESELLMKELKDLRSFKQKHENDADLDQSLKDAQKRIEQLEKQIKDKPSINVNQDSVIISAQQDNHLPDFWREEHLAKATLYFECNSVQFDLMTKVAYSNYEWFKYIAITIKKHNNSIYRDDLQLELGNIVLEDNVIFESFYKRATKLAKISTPFHKKNAKEIAPILDHLAINTDEILSSLREFINSNPISAKLTDEGEIFFTEHCLDDE